MVIISREKRIGAFDDDEESFKQIAKTTLMLAEKAYEDEYDDTLEIYEDDRFKVEGNNDEDEPDDLDSYQIEGKISNSEKETNKPNKRHEKPKEESKQSSDDKYFEKGKYPKTSGRSNDYMSGKEASRNSYNQKKQYHSRHSNVQDKEVMYVAKKKE